MLLVALDGLLVMSRFEHLKASMLNTEADLVLIDYASSAERLDDYEHSTAVVILENICRGNSYLFSRKLRRVREVLGYLWEHFEQVQKIPEERACSISRIFEEYFRRLKYLR